MKAERIEAAFCALSDTLPIDEISQRLGVVQEALTWLGTPYHHHARVRGAGVDCAQLPLAIFTACGLIENYEPEWYPHDWHLHRGEERWVNECEKFMHPTTAPPLPGDLALYRYGRTISHGALVIAWPQIIHAHLGNMTVVLDDAEANSDLARRFVGRWSFWGAK